MTSENGKNNKQPGQLTPQHLKNFQKNLQDAVSQEQKLRVSALESELELSQLRWANLDKFIEHYSKKLDRIFSEHEQHIRDIAKLNNTVFDEFAARQAEIAEAQEKALKRQNELLKARRDGKPADQAKTKEKDASSQKPTQESPANNLQTAIKQVNTTNQTSQSNTIINNATSYSSMPSEQSHFKSLTEATENASAPKTEFKSAEPGIEPEFDEAGFEANRENVAFIEKIQNLTDAVSAEIDTIKQNTTDAEKLDIELYLAKKNHLNDLTTAERERFNALLGDDAELAAERKAKLEELYNRQKEREGALYEQKANNEEEANLRAIGLVNLHEDAYASFAKGERSGGDASIVVNMTKLMNEQQKAKSISAIKDKQDAELNRRLTLAKAKSEDGQISPEQMAEIAASVMKEIPLSQEAIDAESVKAALSAQHDQDMADLKTVQNKDASLKERADALKNLTADENGNFSMGKAAGVALQAAIDTISNFAKQMENTVDEIAAKTSKIDTRLQGSKNAQRSGSYWGQLTSDMISVGLVNPVFKQEDFAKNIEALVERGIAFDLKQRAFLMTIQEKIANTFEVADGTLLRLIRIQQEDSTAGRLGMEASLNAFLNNMFETTEYLKEVASGVRGSLAEMQALMGGADAAAVEYQVQKWMGSLYSVGMSSEAVNSIATSFGQIAAGQIEGLTGGGAGNLLIMAINRAGESIADILTTGASAEQTNKILEAAVSYLGDIAKTSKDNRVVQQQLANVFGVKASDIKAATNLSSSMGIVSSESMTYNQMLGKLNEMADTMINRTSLGEMMTNVWNNGQYSLAASMANSPISYLIYKIAGLLDDTVGGIPLPFINVFGSGFDLNTSVADLMRVGAMAGSVISNLGPIISGLGNIKGGSAMLKTMGIDSGLTAVQRGGGGTGGSGGGSVSNSGYVGNADGGAVKDSTFAEANDVGKQKEVEAKEEEEAAPIDNIDIHVVKIYELLDSVVSGSSSIRIRTTGIGLNAGNESASTIGGWSFF